MKLHIQNIASYDRVTLFSVLVFHFQLLLLKPPAKIKKLMGTLK